MDLPHLFGSQFAQLLFWREDEKLMIWPNVFDIPNSKGILILFP